MRAGYVYYSHMRYVEHTRRFSDAQMLINLGTIMNGQFPAMKVNQLCVGIQMRLVQWCSLAHVEQTG